MEFQQHKAAAPRRKEYWSLIFIAAEGSNSHSFDIANMDSQLHGTHFNQRAGPRLKPHLTISIQSKRHTIPNYVLPIFTT